MGGREEFMVKALFPSYDYEDTQAVIGLDGKEHGIVHLAPIPEECLRYVLNALLPIFCRPNKNPYSPGQYLMDHLDHCIDKIDLNSMTMLGEKERLIEAIYIIRYQSKHPEFQKDNPVIVDIANRLNARFNNREFGSTLMDYWDNIEDLYKEFVESQD